MKNKAIALVMEFIDHCHGTNNEMELMHAKCCAKISIKFLREYSLGNIVESIFTYDFCNEMEEEIDKLTYDDINDLRNEKTN